MRRLPLRHLLIAVLAIWMSGAAGQEVVPGEVMVRFKSLGHLPSSAMRRTRGRIVQRLTRIAVDRVKLPAGVSIARALAEFRSDPAVEFAEPNYVLRLFDVDDPLYSRQWNLGRVFAPQAWGITLGNPSVLVAMLDSGADLTHPDLAGKIADSRNFVSYGPATDGNGHGSHTAGIVAATTNNGFDIASVGYNTRLLIGKVASDTGVGDLANVSEGIAWAVDHGAKVINMSLGTPAYSATLQSAVDDAWSRGVVLVAAAGNYGSIQRVYPAAYSHCIAVASTDQSDRRSSFSSFGDWVHVSAPGQNILSLYKRGNTATMSGTSMAAPHVAALAALLWANGGRSNISIRRAIENSGDPSYNFGSFPAPRMNARRALLRLP